MAMLFRSILLALVFCDPCLAGLLYDEGVDGDLPANTDSSVLPFSSGINRVVGSVSVVDLAYKALTGEQHDFDSFTFTVPQGTKLVAATASWNDVEGDIFGTEWTITAGPFVYAATYLSFARSVSPGSAEFSGLPLSAGTYSAATGTFGAIPNLGVNVNTASYVLEFTIANVPEPTALCLGLLAACRLSHPARRRQW